MEKTQKLIILTMDCASFRFVQRDNYSFKTSYNIDILIFHRFRHEILHDLLSALVIQGL